MTLRMWSIGGKPVVLAHRGGGNEAPENSIVAFQNMSDRGFRYVETDAHATVDGVVVLFHDDTLDRTTNGTGRIENYTWEDLSAIRDDSGNQLLLLRDLLEQFPNLVLNIDAKEKSVVAPLVRTLREADALGRVSLASFSEARLRALRKELPGVVTSLGQEAMAPVAIAAMLPEVPPASWLARGLERLAPGLDKGVQAAQVPHRLGKLTVVTPRFVRLCHSRGLAVHVWTINDADEMRELLHIGVDALITDEPSLAQSVIDEYWASRN